jgi:hypothetical protein
MKEQGAAAAAADSKAHFVFEVHFDALLILPGEAFIGRV